MTAHTRTRVYRGSVRRRLPSRVPIPVLTARVERLYVACVSFALGAAGTAIGFTFGVVPYFRAVDASRYNVFFAACIAAGAFAGFVVGLVNGARWFRADGATPVGQRRMMSYLRRRDFDERGLPQRTVVLRRAN